MENRNQMLRKIAELDFAITDLHLYLDTHPNNDEIGKKIAEYQAKSNAMRSEFEKFFGPLDNSDKNGNRWAWISNPWPWDTQEEDC